MYLIIIILTNLRDLFSMERGIFAIKFSWEMHTKIKASYIAIFLLVIEFFLKLFIYVPPRELSATILGYSLWFLGFIFLIWSVFSLSRHRKRISESLQNKQSFISKGIFRIVRHPIYLSLMLFAFGYIALYFSYVFMAINIFIIVILYFEMISEEKSMISQFGMKYTEYMRRTPRLNFIIGIWRIFFGY